MKKIIFIIIAVCIIALSFVTYLLLNKPSLTTGKIESLQSVTIKASNGEEVELVGSDGNIVFKEFAEARSTRISYPQHLESMQNDPRYTVKIKYKNGDVDIIYSTEILVKWYRFTNTKGSDGDPGYIISNKNSELLKIIEMLFNSTGIDKEAYLPAL